MDSDKSIKKSGQLLEVNELTLPLLPNGLEASFSNGQTFSVDGTNVVRVPFGIRQPRRKRPERPERWATLVLPLQPVDNPTPPPQAA